MTNTTTTDGPTTPPVQETGGVTVKVLNRDWEDFAEVRIEGRGQMVTVSKDKSGLPYAPEGVRINWSALGAVSIEAAEQMVEALQAAIEVGRRFEAEG